MFRSIKGWCAATPVDRVLRRAASAQAIRRARRSRRPSFEIFAPRGPADGRLAPVLDESSTATPTEVDFVLASGSGVSVERNQLRNAALCLAHHALDWVGLDAVPGGSGEAAALVSVPRWRLHQQGGARPPAPGRVLRLPEIGASDRVSSLPGFPPPFESGAANPFSGPRAERPSPSFRVRDDDPRPLVFVLPAVFARGGVERNLIEVLRELSAEYRFVIVTNEPVGADGSLHHQIGDLALAVYELGALAPSSLHLHFLETLRDAYAPDLVWVCNGSPWFVAHARSIRRLFHSIPIVDQQVYDDREGWIRFFGGRRFHETDRFVAINAKIRSAFVGRYSIPGEKVDLIHHGIDARRFCLGTAERLRPRRAAGEGRARTFLFVGRLVAQKRPLEFLELARRARDRGLADAFDLVGEGPMRSDCEAFIKTHGLERARCLRPTDAIETHYARADGLVVTSAYEGLPLCVLEAAAMGLPVLATDVGEIGGVLGDLGIGTVVAPESDAATRRRVPVLRHPGGEEIPRVLDTCAPRSRRVRACPWLRPANRRHPFRS